MKIRLVDEARREFDEAVDYYLKHSNSAAVPFIDAFEEAKKRLSAFPNAGARIRPGSRRILVKRFPYMLVYRVEGGEIVVYAVAHQRRRPGYWRMRVQT